MDEPASAPTPGRTEDGKQPVVDSTTVAAASGTPTSSGHDHSTKPERRGGIILVPQPSSDPRDPLVRLADHPSTMTPHHAHNGR